MPSSNPPVSHVHFDSAQKFIDAISPRGGPFGRVPPDMTWLFRGHSDDAFKLVPKALRIAEAERLHAIARTPVGTAGKKTAFQLLAEANIILDFYKLVDSHGLPIPENSPTTRELLFETQQILALAATSDCEDRIPGSFREWPPAGLGPLLALAQHHGLPTRLLDWTRSAFTAAYFASCGSIKDSTPIGNLAVWALNCAILNVDNSFKRLDADRTPALARIVSAPSWGNPNLHAQSGMFSLLPQEKRHLNDPLDRRGIEDIVAEIDPDNGLLNVSPALYHFTIEKKRGPELLWLLAKEGISGARMFPGYDGIVMAQSERAQWRNPHSTLAIDN